MIYFYSEFFFGLGPITKTLSPLLIVPENNLANPYSFGWVGYSSIIFLFLYVLVKKNKKILKPFSLTNSGWIEIILEMNSMIGPSGLQFWREFYINL